jgi:integrase
VKAPPLIRDRRPDLAIEDAKRLLHTIQGERLEAFFVLALTTGLRRGEVLALRWEDVDLSSRQLRVHQVLQRGRQAADRGAENEYVAADGRLAQAGGPAPARAPEAAKRSAPGTGRSVA